MNRLPFRLFAVAGLASVCIWGLWPNDRAGNEHRDPAAKPGIAYPSANTERKDGSLRPELSDLTESSQQASDAARPGKKLESRFDREVRTRFKWSDAEKQQDWGQLLASWLASGDSAQAMKALMLVHTCVDAKSYSDGLYSANHTKSSEESRRHLERNQARERRCQSVLPLSSAQMTGLIDLALRGGEPSAASFAILWYAERKIPMPSAHSELMRTGLERDFIAGNLHGLQSLAFSAARLGASPVEAFSYEIAWRAVEKLPLGAPVSDDEFDRWLTNAQAAVEKPSSEWLLRDFPDLALRSSRPALTGEELAAAQLKAGQLLTAWRAQVRTPS